MSDNELQVETTPEPEATQVVTPAASEPPELEEFDKERAMATIKNLREIEKKAKRDEKELARLQKAEADRKTAELSEIDRLKLERDELAEKYEATRIENLQRKIAAEVGLPEAFVSRIQGADEEAMIADAQSMLSEMPKVKSAKGSATNPGAGNLAGETDEQRRARIFGRKPMGV